MDIRIEYKLSMDREKEAERDIDYYVSSLPRRSGEEVDTFIAPEYEYVEQSQIYPHKPNPIREVERVELSFVKVGSAKTTLFQKKNVHTYSLWSIVAGLLDSSHLMGNPSMKRCNVQFVTQSLKIYLSDKTIHTFLTGRRIYPLMELLDKPRVDFDKKHQNALGYFLSFLLNSVISVMDNEYTWSRECENANIHIVNNHDGFWKLYKNP